MTVQTLKITLHYQLHNYAMVTWPCYNKAYTIFAVMDYLFQTHFSVQIEFHTSGEWSETNGCLNGSLNLKNYRWSQWKPQQKLYVSSIHILNLRSCKMMTERVCVYSVTESGFKRRLIGSSSDEKNCATCQHIIKKNKRTVYLRSYIIISGSFKVELDFARFCFYCSNLYCGW